MCGGGYGDWDWAVHARNPKPLDPFACKFGDSDTFVQTPLGNRCKPSKSVETALKTLSDSIKGQRQQDLNRIAQLERENADLKRQLFEAKANTPEAKKE